jgi:hypothetical protein
MAKSAGTSQNAKRKSRKLTYFFLNGKLHRSLYINRAGDLITAWSYPEHKRVGYTYSDVKRRREKAFTTAQVSKMINRSRVAIQNVLIRGDIEAPQNTYSIAGYLKDGNDDIYKYMWAEEDVLNLHEYFSQVHFGRPRKDGLINPYPMPSARELRALMRHDEILYIKRGEEFVPLWEAEH